MGTVVYRAYEFEYIYEQQMNETKEETAEIEKNPQIKWNDCSSTFINYTLKTKISRTHQTHFMDEMKYTFIFCHISNIDILYVLHEALHVYRLNL